MSYNKQCQCGNLVVKLDDEDCPTCESNPCVCKHLTYEFLDSFKCQKCGTPARMFYANQENNK